MLNGGGIGDKLMLPFCNFQEAKKFYSHCIVKKT